MTAQLRVSAGKGAICALLALAALSAPASAEVLFDSLGGATSGSFSTSDGPLDATFATGASTFDATDIALNIGQTGGDDGSNTVTVKLVGGIPLADLSFDPDLGLNVSPGGVPLIASTTFVISDLSIGLTVEHFNEFAGIPLKPDSLYWIDITSTTSGFDDALVTWCLTSDVSGVGVAENYNSSDATDFGFFQSRRAALCRRCRVPDGGQRNRGPRVVNMDSDAPGPRWLGLCGLACAAKDSSARGLAL
jgi:hypothetical protein